VLKRERERARTEKAARKREEKSRRQERGGTGSGPPVATRDELDGYGLPRGASGDPFDDGAKGS
jgi:hypothetical protein